MRRGAAHASALLSSRLLPNLWCCTDERSGGERCVLEWEGAASRWWGQYQPSLRAPSALFLLYPKQPVSCPIVTSHYNFSIRLIGSPGYISVASLWNRRLKRSDRDLNALTPIKNGLHLLKKSLQSHAFPLLTYKTGRKERHISEARKDFYIHLLH